jgi:hypothetical protein
LYSSMKGKQGRERVGKGTWVSMEWEIGKCKDQLTFLFPAFVYRIVHVEGNRETGGNLNVVKCSKRCVA